MARIISAEKAQQLLDGDPLGRGLITDLAHTVVVQAEQIAAVINLHTGLHRCIVDGVAADYLYCTTARALGVTA